MNDQKMNKQGEVKNNINSVVVAVTGAVIGAGIAVAGVALSDKKNKEKVKNFTINVQKKVETKKKEIEKKIMNDKEKVKKVINSAKNSLDKTTKEVNKAVSSL